LYNIAAAHFKRLKELKMATIRTHWALCMLLVPVFLSGCVAAPQEPTATAPPTGSPTVEPVLPSATPVETEFIATSAEDIVGIWSFSYFGKPWRIRFLTNGMIRSGTADNPEEFLHGMFEFKGTIFQVEEESCGPGTYEAHVIQRDGQNYKLYFVVIEDTCRDRVNEMKRGYWWVGP
jgi:hypothetical protein